MRKRNKAIIIRLTENEYSDLKKNVAKTGLTTQAYFRKLMADLRPAELPPMDFFEVLKSLRQIDINLRQLALQATSFGFVDAVDYRKNIKALEAAISEIKETVRG